MQMIASQRRLDYSRLMLVRALEPARTDPSSDMFDPERAAVIHSFAGRTDEAAWLLFLAVHFGKHPVAGWSMVQDIYSGLGDGMWTWDRVSRSPARFRAWLNRRRADIRGSFGNHRKYESLNDGTNGTATVVESYLKWVGGAGSHGGLFGRLIREGGNDPHTIFDRFYQDMRVARFGRLGKFDFLCLLGRLGLAPIEPGSAYLRGATGPLRGARLLFGGTPDAPIGADTLEDWLRDVDQELNVGMQVMEDSLCNWQKSPAQFVHFKG
jgi:hypothetical protein